jgi:hypothetical protein
MTIGIFLSWLRLLRLLEIHFRLGPLLAMVHTRRTHTLTRTHTHAHTHTHTHTHTYTHMRTHRWCVWCASTFPSSRG